MFGECVGDVLDMFWVSLRHALVCFGNASGLFWKCFGDAWLCLARCLADTWDAWGMLGDALRMFADQFVDALWMLCGCFVDVV